MRRLLSPDFGLDISQDHLSAFGQIIDLRTSPPRLADTGIEVIKVVLLRPAVRAAADAMFDRLRIIAEERFDINIVFFPCVSYSSPVF